MSNSVRYPAQFEMSRLEALGDPPYLELDEARRRYTEGKSVRVVAAGDPPAWFLLIAPKRYRFTLTFYATTGTPVREVMWEDDGGELFCRRVIDLFYPDGDPVGRIAYNQAFSVTQQISPDGVIGVTLASPLGDDEFHEISLTALDRYRIGVPAFDEWSPLLESSAPPELERFGLDALDEVTAFAETCVSADTTHRTDQTGTRRDGWRVSATVGDVMRTVDAVVTGVSSRSSLPVLDRGVAHVLPLVLQVDPKSGHPSDEELRRMTVLANEIRDACEHQEGQGIALELDRISGDSIGSYLEALRADGTTDATFWEFGPAHAVVLVWQRDEDDGILSLSVHVVPASWVSPRRVAAAAVDKIDVNWSLADVIDQRPRADVAE